MVRACDSHYRGEGRKKMLTRKEGNRMKGEGKEKSQENRDKKGRGLPQFLKLFFHCETSISHLHMEIFFFVPCGFPVYLVFLYMFSQTGLCHTKYILLSKLLEKKEE